MYVVIGVIVVVIILAVAVLLIWGIGSHRPSGFGTWETDDRGACNTSSNSCTDIGKRLITRTCIPNPSTGKGCIDDDGKQVYGQLISSEDCTPTCRRSVWTDHSTGPCVVSGISTTHCVDSNAQGQREITVECVSNDAIGTNMCTSLELLDLVGPTGELDESHQITTYNIGDTVTFTRQCSDYANPPCGQWQLVRPLDRDFSKPIGEGDPDDSAVPCSFDIQLTLEPDCQTGVASPFNGLLEGYIVEPLSCLVDNIATKPDDSDPPLEICGRIETSPVCNNTMVTPSQIKSGTLPSDFNPVLCPGNDNSSNNSQCVRACRMFPGSTSIGGGEFDQLLGNILMMRIPGYGYVGAIQTPSNDGQIVKFRDSGLSQADDLDDTPLMAIPNTLTRPQCTSLDPETNIEFNSAVVLSLGPRSYLPGKLTAQISCLINGSYNGWLGLSGNVAKWQQMYNTYLGPGITSDSAITFNISNVSFVSEAPPQGFPSEYLGRASLDLKDTSDNTVYVMDVDGVPRPLNTVEVLVFENSVDLTTRTNRDKGNCNVLHDTNGVP